VYVIYRPFFQKVVMMEALADKAKASGKDPLNRSRAAVKQGAKLTDAEDQFVRGVAKDYKTAIEANRQQLQEYRAQAQTQSAQGQPMSDQVRAQGMNLNRNTMWIVLDRVQQLKSTLGDTRFNQLDSFVHTWVQPGSLKSMPKK
jgi:hypothetical protein